MYHAEFLYSTLLSRFPERSGSASAGWDVRCPCNSNHKKNGYDKRASARIWIDGDRMRWWCGRGCTWKECREAIGSNPREWFERTARMAQDAPIPRKQVEIEDRYRYEDENGELRFEVVRTNPKGFWQRRPGPGNKGWVYDLGPCYVAWSDDNKKWLTEPINEKADNLLHPKLLPRDVFKDVTVLGEVRMIPFNLPEIKKRASDPLYVVEGEKAAKLLNSLGFLATCSPRGAGKWPIEFGGYLAGRNCVLFPDNDEPGEKHMAMVAGSGMLFGARTIKTVYAASHYDIGDGEDVYDWLARIGKANDTPMRLRDTRRSALIDLVQRYGHMAFKPSEYKHVEVMRSQVTKIKGEKRVATARAAAARKAKAADPGIYAGGESQDTSIIHH